MKLRPSILLVAAATVLGATACRTTPPAPPAPVINQDSIDNAARLERERLERERLERERLERERLERERLERDRAAAAAAAAEAANRARAAMDAARAAFATAIYFDLDKSDLKAEARAMLDSKLPMLRANMNVRIRIAGHADDRGSDEYNVALGQRRAAAAKRYLVDQGIAADRIDVVSFGEERPSAMGTGEENWAKNRRDEFEIIVGSETLRLP